MFFIGTSLFLDYYSNSHFSLHRALISMGYASCLTRYCSIDVVVEMLSSLSVCKSKALSIAEVSCQDLLLLGMLNYLDGTLFTQVLHLLI